jgi:pimeloyl-ACP methyl ester carboxylesterase
MKGILRIASCLAIFGSVCFAQDIAGDWQGALQGRTQTARLLVHIDKGAGGGWEAWLAGLNLGDEGQRIPADSRPLIKELLESTLPAFERDLREQLKTLDAAPPAALAAQAQAPTPAPTRAIMSGTQKYNKIPVPILAIYAVPHDLGPQASPEQEARDLETVGAVAKAFEAGLPTAKVVRIAHANHYVFRSNEADVLREIDAFVGGLK